MLSLTEVLMPQKANLYTLEDFKNDFELSISPNLRPLPLTNDLEKIHNWLFNLFPNINCSLQTRILSCYYLDEFLIKKPEINNNIYKLAAVVCLRIALKYEENIILAPEDINRLSENRYSENLVNTIEMYILATLDWKLALKTPLDFIRMIIAATCKKRDMMKVIEKAEVFVREGLLCNNTLSYSEFYLAVASISLALRTLGYKVFLEEWWGRISATLNTSQQDVEVIEKNIINLAF